MTFDLDTINGLAGIAALVNSLLLVPTVRALKAIAEDHGSRLAKLESSRKSGPRAGRKA